MPGETRRLGEQVRRHAPYPHPETGGQQAAHHRPRSAPPVPSLALFHDPRLGGRGNAPVRAAVLQRMQQTAGNRATRRFLQRTTRRGRQSAEDQAVRLPDAAVPQMAPLLARRAPAAPVQRRPPASGAPVAIQRLLFDSKDLIGLVGKPKSGYFYSRTYKKIIAELDTYHKAYQKQNETQRLGSVRKSLGTMLELMDKWLGSKAETPGTADDRNIPAMRAFRQDVEKEYKAAEDVGTPGAGYSDLNAKQYRVTGAPPDRQVEEVERRKGQDGTVTYYALGLVVGFNQNRPLMEYYPKPKSLGDWYPRVTHLNGMAVAPKSGIRSAEELQQSINDSLRASAQGDGAALDVAALDVLYTYSATRGLAGDLWECIKGKFGAKDAPTIKQEEIMLDAVHRQKRTTVSAHSRGTIKTDNAVRLVYDKLVEENVPQALDSGEAQEIAAAAARRVRDDYRIYQQAGLDLSGIDPRLLAQAVAADARQRYARQHAKQKARDDMNKFIELVYAGNAVWLPTSVLPADFFVARADLVSLVVGSYNDWRKPGGGQVKHVKGGHGFIENYSGAVGKLVAKDIRKDYKVKGR